MECGLSKGAVNSTGLNTKDDLDTWYGQFISHAPQLTSFTSIRDSS
jgi:hypothetical protein